MGLDLCVLISTVVPSRPLTNAGQALWTHVPAFRYASAALRSIAHQPLSRLRSTRSLISSCPSTTYLPAQPSLGIDDTELRTCY